MNAKVPREILEKARQIRGKRSRVVVDHILKHGSITTEDLENYGYKHPPRAVRDVREQGLPVEMFWTRSSDGRKIAGYRFGSPHDIRYNRLGGRRVFSKEFVSQVIEANGGRCGICRTGFERRYLQVDHRIPYEVVGDVRQRERDVAGYMPLCGSCNRAKSWSCEHCENWKNVKDSAICNSCYWARPDSYTHIAMREIRRLDIVWEENEVEDFNALTVKAGESDEAMPDYVKEVLRRHLKNRSR